MDFKIAGKTALITGASRGIGYATAAVLASEGARVIAIQDQLLILMKILA